MKAQILDLSLSVKQALRALAYPRYLAAMWVITSELVEAYGSRNTPDSVDLAGRSLTLLRTAVDGSPEDVRADARPLKLEWFALTGVCEEGHDDEAPPFDLPVDPGAGNLWWVMRDLMAELETGIYLYSAIGSVTRAVTMLADSDSAADDAPSVELLHRCLAVVRLVGEADGDRAPDLEEVRAVAFHG
ncbi:hypothetical protein [Catellatospora sp. NPDC049133]|jgi:hypothetical protein|uniref:hypothetical protein n=1 Tax=Catellatospora sp. NPDC049133 TaxID=3155499 RepID=UPI0033D00424